MLYADQESGLAPEEVQMTSDGRRWMEVVDEWELGGRKGDVPPGMGEPGPERDPSKRDYYPYQRTYYLRPEVRFFLFLSYQ
jgi:mannosyl-oligosaccharide alpha-1,2-mannosidase